MKKTAGAVFKRQKPRRAAGSRYMVEQAAGTRTTKVQRLIFVEEKRHAAAQIRFS
jgi:hypothetical protein